MNSTLRNYLEKHNIKYILHTHPAVFSVQEAEIHCKDIPGLPGKNLFLKDKKDGSKILVIMNAFTKLKIKELAKQLGKKHLTFASPKELLEILKVTPGSVSAFCLINNTKKIVETIIDKEIWDAKIVNFHPNKNTASLELKKEEFHKYIESLVCSYKIMKLDF